MAESLSVVPQFGPSGMRAPIRLADAANFRMACLVIEPPRNRVVHDDGRVETLEPRVMQALVALGTAGGRVLTRKDLVRSCWNGAVVSDDAVNRVISRLRALQRGVGAGCFTVETLSKVGYQLREAESAPSALPLRQTHLEHATPLLAVLLFDTPDADPGCVRLAEGIKDALIHTLAQATGVRVINRRSSVQLLGSDKTAATVMARLNATHILDGSVRRSRDTFRITVELSSCSSETCLWSRQFERERPDVFSLEDEVAAGAAAGLKSELARLKPALDVAPEALELYTRARAPSHDRWWLDIPLLERAVARSPRFARAWEVLAIAYADAWGSCPPIRRAEVEAKSRAAASTALELDPEGGCAHVALGMLQPKCGAALEVDTLVTLVLAKPVIEPESLMFASAFHTRVGRNREALSFAAEAAALDPSAPQYAGWHARMLSTAGHREQADIAFDDALRRFPGDGATMLLDVGRTIETSDWARFDRVVAGSQIKGIHAYFINVVIEGGVRIRNWSARDSDHYSALLREELRGTETVTLREMGFGCRAGMADEIYSILGQADFSHLFKPEGRLAGLDFELSLLFDPGWAPMREDRRFVGFCARLGLVDYWIRGGHWPDCADEVPYDFRSECRRLAAA